MMLSSEQIEFITKYPLTLDQFRATLQDATGAPSGRTAQRLLALLNASIVADSLRVVDFLYSEITHLNISPEADRFAPLISVVAADAPDTEIWAAVLKLRDSAALPTPLTPQLSVIDATCEVTSVKYSSDRLEDSTNRESIEEEVFLEIKDCTFPKVEGFWNKFFNSDAWPDGPTQMLSRIMKEFDHRCQVWKDFPPTPDPTSVCNWLRSLEDRHLADAPNKLYTSPHGYASKEAKGEMDVFFQLRTSGKNVEFRNVLVAGEQKSTYSTSTFKANLVQLTRLMRNVFADQPTRRFVHAFLLCASTMELWVFDRAGPYSSGAFDIQKEPEKFGRALVGYATMDQAALGLDTFIDNQQQDPQTTVDKADTIHSSGGIEEIHVKLADLLVKRNGIVCRGTTCYKSQDGQVAKFSWASAKRELEVDQLKQARERGVTGVVRVVGYRQITTIAELRAGLRFSERHNFQESQERTDYADSLSLATSRASKRKHAEISNNTSTLQNRRLKRQKDLTNGSSLQSPVNTTKQGQDAAKQQWEDSIYSCLVVSPAGRMISDFDSIKELLEALQDAIRAHLSLYEVGQILHRDISSNNIIITRPEENEGGFKGMLIDLDLAKGGNCIASGSRQQTGTLQFMAVGVLRGEDHTYRHDLESFFYVLLWMCARRSWGKSQFRGDQDSSPTSLLQYWYKGTLQSIIYAKVALAVADELETILAEFPEPFETAKPLCRKIRNILFSVNHSVINYGTPEDFSEVYRQVIEAYDDTIKSQS
ncbi:serine/threonine-protein kinase Sgk2 [Nemania serpens]|nr:serine/threonine-protein kinase Sgk2 [Nemania serpens]